MNDQNYFKISTEYLLLGTFLAISGVMLYMSFSFSSRARLFPQVTAIVTIISSLLLLFRGYFPDQASEFFSTSPAIDHEGDDSTQEVERSKMDLFILATFIVGYVVLAYLISFVYASPVFVLVYTIYHHKRWYKVLGLTILGYAIPYGFLVSIGGPIDSGLLI